MTHFGVFFFIRERLHGQQANQHYPLAPFGGGAQISSSAGCSKKTNVCTTNRERWTVVRETCSCECQLDLIWVQVAPKLETKWDVACI